MLPLSPDFFGRNPRTLLCLGAHCDDIEIGSGGTVLRLAEHYPDLHVYWVVLILHTQPWFVAMAAQLAGEGIAPHFNPILRRGFKEHYGLEELKSRIAPDLVLTHTRGDLHQDHRLTCELTWNTFRDHLILEQEIPKYDGDLGAPNVFVPLQLAHCEAKVTNIIECFPSQHDHPWFTRETFMALMRLRGVESNAPSGYAEAFYCRKAVLGLGRGSD